VCHDFESLTFSLPTSKVGGKTRRRCGGRAPTRHPCKYMHIVVHPPSLPLWRRAEEGLIDQMEALMIRSWWGKCLRASSICGISTYFRTSRNITKGKGGVKKKKVAKKSLTPCRWRPSGEAGSRATESRTRHAASALRPGLDASAS